MILASRAGQGPNGPGNGSRQPPAPSASVGQMVDIYGIPGYVESRESHPGATNWNSYRRRDTNWVEGPRSRAQPRGCRRANCVTSLVSSGRAPRGLDGLLPQTGWMAES